MASESLEYRDEMVELLRPLDVMLPSEPFDVTTNTMTLQYYIGKPIKKLGTTLIPTSRNFYPKSVIDGILEINRSLGGGKKSKEILKESLAYIANVTGSTIAKIHIITNSVIECIASHGEPKGGRLTDRKCTELFTRDCILSTSSLLQDPRSLINLLTTGKSSELVSIPISCTEFTARLTLTGTTIYTTDTISSVILPYSRSLHQVIIGTVAERVGSAASMPAVERRLRRMEAECSSKDMFLATMSHEIRTPLNGIMGIISMLKDSGPLNSRQKKHVQTLMECAVELTSLLNNILDYSKMRSNRLSLSLKGESIEEIVDTALKIAGGSAYMKKIELKREISSEIEGKTVLCDKQRLLQILGNLLGNSIKFTPASGTIICRTIVLGNRLIFEIEDTGCGIEESKLEHIFEVFYQIGPSHGNEHTPTEGSGLGLPISKELVKLMGGEIVAKSTVNKGTSISFYIPLRTEQKSRELILEENKHILQGKKVLIVDAKSDMRLYLSDVTLKWGCMPIALQTTEEALQYIHHGMEFDIAIIDLSANGVQLASELRVLRETLPLIAISDLNLPAESKEKKLFDSFLLKPVNITLLLLSVIELISNTKVPTPRVSIEEESKPDVDELEIVVAEDDGHNIYTIKELLRTIGVVPENIRYAKDGEECCKLCTERPPHLVLMDIRMPIMNGIEATRIVKRVARPPIVIALSASIQPKDMIKCELAGFDSYLSKPISKEQLIEAIIPLVNRDGGKKKFPIRSSRRRRDRCKAKRRDDRKMHDCNK
jgi:signal transduction histidine kinase/DNA-binding response OmpR family regulator